MTRRSPRRATKEERQSALTRALDWVLADPTLHVTETEVERLCRIGRERQDLRARVRAEILGQVPAWGMSPFEAGDLLEQLGQMIKANAEAMRRASRGGR